MIYNMCSLRTKNVTYPFLSIPTNAYGSFLPQFDGNSIRVRADLCASAPNTTFDTYDRPLAPS